MNYIYEKGQISRRHIRYIGFSVDNSDLIQISKKGWMTYNYSENEIEDKSVAKITRRYKLFFPPEEMKKVFIKENLVKSNI